MQTKRSIEELVLTRINNEIGNDFKKLHRAAILLEEYKERMQLIARKLNYEDDDQNAESSIRSLVEFQKQASDSIDFQCEKLEQFRKKLVVKIQESKAILDATHSDLAQVRKLQNLLQYLRIVQDIQEISALLKNALSGRDEAKMVNIYLTLYEDNDCENSVIGRLQGVEAPFLKSFALQTAMNWYSKLKEHLSRQFENVLKQMRWGQKEQDFLTHAPPRDCVAKAQVLAEYLFLVRPPIREDESEEIVTITSSIICQPVSTVTSLLLAPYRQRFMYHFTGTRKTNRLDKPEWYFTQILNWAKESHLFVGEIFQSAAIKAGKLDFNIRLEFLRGLVQLTIEKLAVDIKEISQNESLFAHLLDETLAFEIELRELFGYPSSFPSAISVLTQPYYLLKWISLEERFCTGKMDAILQGEDPWMLIDPNVYDDELKIPRCADQFMCLLEAIKDRYYSLIQPGHQLQFLNLQLELIDNFRRRLVQLHSGGIVSTVRILNAVNYITMVLREWGENVHYLHLHAALIGINATEINSVFEQPISEMDHWIKELIQDLAMKAVNEIKAKSMLYRHDNWSTLPEQNAKEPFILSSSAGEMFQVAVTILHNLESELSLNIFNITLRSIAKEIDEYLLNNLIMTTKFSTGGAAQFNYDMTRNLFTIFGQYTRRPDLLFKRIHDALILLNAARGTALLLHETLNNESPIEAKIAALKEQGILNFNPKTCIEVLEQRGDIRLL